MYGRLGDAYSSQLLDGYLAAAHQCPAGILSAVALRTGSLIARRLFERAACPDLPLERLIAAGRANRVPGTPVDPAAVAELARLLALQELLPDDASDALALYDLALTVGGPDGLASQHQGIHAQLAFLAGDRARVANLLATYPALPPRVEQELVIDLANPFVAEPFGVTRCDSAEKVWLQSFAQLLPEPGLSLSGPAALPPFDRLTGDSLSRTGSGVLVSVIVTTYRPGPELLTAVRSLVDQSWSELDIVLVDDASPADCDLVLKQCLELDPRIRLLRLDVNRGTYVARNTGIDAAIGSVVTFQDSDDWSHPGRIEHQLRSLLADPTRVATVTDSLRVTDHLVISRPGRQSHLLCPSSLMYHKGAMVERVGYFDPVRKGADGEFLSRIEAAFGTEAVWRDRGMCYTLRRLSSGSLSEQEFRAGWMHPARAAYKSAYYLWHEQIRAGLAEPYRPADGRKRPFPAPAQLRRSASEREESTNYDVLFVGDWRSEPPALEQIGALIGSGLRVGVAQLESLRAFATQPNRLCRPVQELINRRDIDHVVLTDPAEVSLVLLHHPTVVQFPPSYASRVRARQVVIIAARPPVASDGTGVRYHPTACVDAVRTLFGPEPTWCPTRPAVRKALAPALRGGELRPFDYPETVDINRWSTDRGRFRLDRPVVGRHVPDAPGTWPSDPDELLAPYSAADFDVRILGGAKTLRTVLGTTRFPPNWIIYDDDLDVRSFLNQLDFYLYFPPRGEDPPVRELVEALAAGCVTILPHTFAPFFGDAAMYSRPVEVPAVVRALYANPSAHRAQIRRARAWLEDRHTPAAYSELIKSLLSANAPLRRRDGEGPDA